jgi:hypothetical protein
MISFIEEGKIEVNVTDFNFIISELLSLLLSNTLLIDLIDIIHINNNIEQN